MQTFRMMVIWSMVAYVDVEAGSLEDAKAILEAPDTSLPDDGDYLEDSFTVDLDGSA